MGWSDRKELPQGHGSSQQLRPLVAPLDPHGADKPMFPDSGMSAPLSQPMSAPLKRVPQPLLRNQPGPLPMPPPESREPHWSQYYQPHAALPLEEDDQYYRARQEQRQPQSQYREQALGVRDGPDQYRHMHVGESYRPRNGPQHYNLQAPPRALSPRSNRHQEGFDHEDSYSRQHTMPNEYAGQYNQRSRRNEPPLSPRIWSDYGRTMRPSSPLYGEESQHQRRMEYNQGGNYECETDWNDYRRRSSSQPLAWRMEADYDEDVISPRKKSPWETAMRSGLTSPAPVSILRSKADGSPPYHVTFSGSTEFPDEDSIASMRSRSSSSVSILQGIAVATKSGTSKTKRMQEESEARQQILKEIRQAMEMRDSSRSRSDVDFWESQVRSLQESLRNFGSDFTEGDDVREDRSATGGVPRLVENASRRGRVVAPIAEEFIKVRASADLEEGDQFSLRSGDTMIVATVPRGGVRKGEVFSIGIG